MRKTVPALWTQLETFLARVDTICGSDAECGEQVSEMLQTALQPGLRLRPMLMYAGYLSTRTDREPPLEMCELAAAFELIHKASLIIDDFVDGDSFRRGKPAFHSHYGPAAVALFPLRLVARANSLVLGLLSEKRLELPARVLDYYNELGLALTRGALREAFGLTHLSSLEECLAIAADQSGTSIKVALASGACFSNSVQVERLPLWEEIGFRCGVLFQVLNDLKGVAAAAERALDSKSHWSDVINGKKNAVLAVARMKAPEAIRRRLEDESSLGVDSHERVEGVLELVSDTGALAYVQEWINEEKTALLGLLEGIPESQIKFMVARALERLRYDLLLESDSLSELLLELIA